MGIYQKWDFTTNKKDFTTTSPRAFITITRKTKDSTTINSNSRRDSTTTKDSTTTNRMATTPSSARKTRTTGTREKDVSESSKLGTASVPWSTITSPRNPTQPTKSRARPSPTSSPSRSCVRSSRSSSRTSTPTSSSRTAETKSPSPPSSQRSAEESSPPPSTTAPPGKKKAQRPKRPWTRSPTKLSPSWFPIRQPFHKPNDVQDAACMKVVAGRLCEEAFYEWATKNDSKSISSDPEKQAKQAASIAKTVTDAVVGLLNKEVLPQSAE